jgi:hypothetical protein
MTSFAGTAAWNAERHRSCGLPISRGWEIAAIVLGFVFAWPVALAYVFWKVVGYPMPEHWRTAMEQKVGWTFRSRRRFSGPFYYGATTGNSAFEDYRRRELERLEEERRRLDEESRAFAEFVEELKRAKDREEFDAFMAKRRGAAQA